MIMPGIMREKSCLPVHSGFGLRMAGWGTLPSQEGNHMRRFMRSSWRRGEGGEGRRVEGVGKEQKRRRGEVEGKERREGRRNGRGGGERRVRGKRRGKKKEGGRNQREEKSEENI